MNHKRRLVLILFMGLILPARAAVQTATADRFPLTIEVEDFWLRGGKVINDRDAGNGKAVLSLNFDFNARIVVAFKEAGRYQLTLYEKAENGSSDSIHIKIDNDPYVRTYPDADGYGVYAPCRRTAPINLKAPGEVTINLFTTNEYGACYDKVVIDKLE